MKDLTPDEEAAYNLCLGAPMASAKAWTKVTKNQRVLRDKLALIEVTVALWEAGAHELRNQTHEILASDFARANVMDAHAEVVRDIIKGE